MGNLTLIREDGTGKGDANAYADVAECSAYFDGHLYAAAWITAAALTDAPETALVWATRLIDAEYQFGGSRASETQALQWPRVGCFDPDKAPATGFSALLLANPFVSTSVVPKAVRDATCEMARELLLVDRTASPAGEGLKYQNVGTTQTGYDNRKVNAALVQGVETARAILETTPQGQTADAQFVKWLKDHQKEAGVFTTVAALVDNLTDNEAAKLTAQEIAERVRLAGQGA